MKRRIGNISSMAASLVWSCGCGCVAQFSVRALHHERGTMKEGERTPDFRSQPCVGVDVVIKDGADPAGSTWMDKFFVAASSFWGQAQEVSYRLMAMLGRALCITCTQYVLGRLVYEDFGSLLFALFETAGCVFCIRGAPGSGELPSGMIAGNRIGWWRCGR